MGLIQQIIILEFLFSMHGGYFMTCSKTSCMLVKKIYKHCSMYTLMGISNDFHRLFNLTSNDL